MSHARHFEEVVQQEFQQVLNERAKARADHASQQALYQKAIDEIAKKVNPIQDTISQIWDRLPKIAKMVNDFSVQLQHFFSVEFHNVMDVFETNPDNYAVCRKAAEDCHTKYRVFYDGIINMANELQIPLIKPLRTDVEAAQQAIAKIIENLRYAPNSDANLVKMLEENSNKAIKELIAAIDALADNRKQVFDQKKAFLADIAQANEMTITLLQSAQKIVKEQIKEAEANYQAFLKLRADFNAYVKAKQSPDGGNESGTGSSPKDSPSAGPATPPSDSVSPMSLASSRRSSNVSMKRESPEHSPKHTPPKEGSILAEQKVKEDKKAGVLDFSRLQISGAERRAVSPASRAVSPSQSRPLGQQPSAPSAAYFPAEVVSAGHQPPKPSAPSSVYAAAEPSNKPVAPSAPSLQSGFGDKRVNHPPTLHRPTSPRAAQQAQQQQQSASAHHAPKCPVG